MGLSNSGKQQQSSLYLLFLLRLPDSEHLRTFTRVFGTFPGREFRVREKKKTAIEPRTARREADGVFRIREKKPANESRTARREVGGTVGGDGDTA
jgi:hypothetical protein